MGYFALKGCSNFSFDGVTLLFTRIVIFLALFKLFNGLLGSIDKAVLNILLRHIFLFGDIHNPCENGFKLLNNTTDPGIIYVKQKTNKHLACIGAIIEQQH